MEKGNQKVTCQIICCIHKEEHIVIMTEEMLSVTNDRKF